MKFSILNFNVENPNYEKLILSKFYIYPCFYFGKLSNGRAVAYVKKFFILRHLAVKGQIKGKNYKFITLCSEKIFCIKSQEELNDKIDFLAELKF